jgi:hypothetical protein
MLTASAALAQDATAWLNARDLGASGSEFETVATTVADAKTITVKDVGDFQVGQGVTLSRCCPRILNGRLWGPGSTYGHYQGKPPLKDVMDIRGLDEKASGWTVYVVDIEPVAKPSFRWSDDMARTWKPKVPITFEWQPLAGGLEVRFKKFEWEKGYTATFNATDRLESVIEKIEGNVITLKDAPTRAVTDAVLRHRDQPALQAAVDRALKEKKNLYIPPGRYRLSSGLNVQKPSGLVIAGQDGEQTVLDISEGHGLCVAMRGGSECTVRDFKMIGNMGFENRDQCGHFPTWGSRGIWGQDLKTSFATGVVGTERVLVQNVHAYRMSLEAFWSGGPGRSGNNPPPPNYSKSIIYDRCWAIDCGRNAFNNNDYAEGTTIVNCRIVDVGGCAWEGASRFVKFQNNYVRNAGTVAIGNSSDTSENMEILGTAQHVISGNVFESVVPYGGCAIRSANGAVEVCITSNLFVNFGSNAVEVWGLGDAGHLGSAYTNVTGNIFDMTEVGPTSKPRHCLQVLGAENTIVSDNQMYVRGACDPQVTALKIVEPALNVIVHDNLMRNCGNGLQATTAQSRVGEIIDPQTFKSAGGQVPLPRRKTARYAGYSMMWSSGGKLQGPVTMGPFDRATNQFKLAAPTALKTGDMFEVFPPAANWNIHDNLITGCLNPVTLNIWGSPTTVLRHNLIERGEATGVKQGALVAGRCDLIGNRFVGFDEQGSAAVMLQPDRLGRVCANLLLRNIFLGCPTPIAESQKGLWQRQEGDGNVIGGK